MLGIGIQNKGLKGGNTMYLREIQLSLPYRKNPEALNQIMIQHNCTYEEAIKIDHDNNWMIPVRRRFELETRCIAAIYVRLLGKYKTKDCSKILIECVEKEPETVYPCYRGSFVGIGLVRYELDYINFLRLHIIYCWFVIRNYLCFFLI